MAPEPFAWGLIVIVGKILYPVPGAIRFIEVIEPTLLFTKVAIAPKPDPPEKTSALLTVEL